MNLVKKSIDLMLVFLFTISFVPAFAEDYAGNSRSNPSESLAVLEARLQSVANAIETVGKAKYDTEKIAALDIIISALKGISMPSKCKPLLVDTIESFKAARANTGDDEWKNEGDLYFYQGHKEFQMLCHVLAGKVVGRQ